MENLDLERKGMTETNRARTMITIRSPSIWERLKRWMGFKPTHTATNVLFHQNKDGDYEWHGDIIPKAVMEKILKDNSGQMTITAAIVKEIRKGKPITVSMEGVVTGWLNAQWENKSTTPRTKD